MAPRGSASVTPRDDRADATAGGGPVDDPERYEEVGEHARGGLGRIVRAVDKRLGRTVAVKELLRRDAGDASEARFLREAMITARLEHPGIVPVHEAGRWPNGDPYYVMKLVEGRTLKELIAETATLRCRLALLPHVIAVADAVGYAHSEGVIHRDLKPSNVVVGAFGETIVVDWGLARDLRQPIDAEIAAQERQVVGTPAYMSPEQARGDTVDERADVYAIGAVLYELLAGRSPHADDTSCTPQELIDRVLAGPPLPLRAVVPDVPPELAGLVGKAMARDPVRRYAHATALAEDLRRFQTGQLVSAHRYTGWELVRRRLAAHRGVVAVAAASAVALGALGIMSVTRVVAERNNANVERGRAENALESAEERKQQLVLLQAETALRKDPTAALAWLKVAVAEPETRDVRVAPHGGMCSDMVDVADEAEALGVAQHVFRAGDWVFDAQFTPDGRSLVAVVRDGSVRAYDLRTGQTRIVGRAPPSPEAMALSADGQTVVTGSAGGQVIAWSLAGAVPPRTLLHSDTMIASLRISDDGRRVLVGRMSGPPQVVEMDGSKSTRWLAPSNGLLAAVAPGDWSHVVAQVAPNQLAVIGVGGAARPLAHTDKAIKFVAVAPCGDLVLVHDGAQVWQVPFGGGPLHAFAAYDGKLQDAVWSPDAGTVALIGTRAEITLVDIAAGTTRELRGHTDQLYSAQFTRDGKTLLTASDDGSARVWSLADGSSQVLLGHDDDVYRARFSPDEHSAVTASLDGSIRVWPIAPATGGRSFSEGGGEVQTLAVEGDLALVKTASSLARWNLATGAREPLFAWGADPHGLGIGVAAPDGEGVALLAADNTLELRHRTGAPVILRGHHGLITHVEFSADSRWLYSSSYDGTVRRWDAATGKGETVLRGDAPVRGFAVAHDGRVVAQIGDAATLIPAGGGAPVVLGTGAAWCASYAMFEPTHDWLVMHRCDNSLALLEGTHLLELPTSGYAIVRVVVSPDGQRIAAALGDRTVREWDASGKLVATLRGHSDLVMDVAFSPDGRSLASASYDKTVRVWDLVTGHHRVLRGHGGPVDRIVWPAANEIVTGSADGTLRAWTVPSLAAPALDELATRLDAATSATIDNRDRPTSR